MTNFKCFKFKTQKTEHHVFVFLNNSFNLYFALQIGGYLGTDYHSAENVTPPSHITVPLIQTAFTLETIHFQEKSFKCSFPKVHRTGGITKWHYWALISPYNVRRDSRWHRDLV